jgi:peptidoglycan/LPS O-acetylase OafA/YrhL
MWSGVNLFFIASGFINGKNFISCKSIKQFIIKRIARIAPLYFLFMFIGIIFWSRGNNFFYSENYNIFIPLFFLSGIDFISNNLGPAYFSITWSLSVEIQLYILTVFILLIKKTKIKLLICIALFLLSLIVPHLSKEISHFGFIMHIDEYLIGVFIRFIFDNKFSFNIKFFQCIYFEYYWIAIPFIIYLLRFDVNLGNATFDNILLCFYTSLFYFILKFNLVKSKILNKIGVNCYFIYLFHIVIFYGIFYASKYFYLFGHSMISVLISFALTFALSIASMKYFENPSRLGLIKFLSNTKW